MDVCSVPACHRRPYPDQTSPRSRLQRTRLPRLVGVLSGSPVPGTGPFLAKLYREGHVALTMTVLRVVTVLALIGVNITAWSVIGPWVPLAAAPWTLALIVGSLRWFQLELGHHGIHSWRARRRVKPPAAAAGAVLPIAPHEDRYLDDHMAHHEPDTFATEGDPDAISLAKVGYVPGRPANELRSLLRRALVSPSFHAEFLATRLGTQLEQGNWCRRMIVTAVIAIVGVVTFSYPAPALVFIVFPLTVGYQMSALLQFATEHSWGAPVPEDARRPEALSLARIAADDPADYPAWIWWLRLATIHTWARWAILPGGMPAHDAHHVVPGKTAGEKLLTATHVRADLIAASSYPSTVPEVWGGLAGWIRFVTNAMSTTNPTEPSRRTQP